jgi:hypothetical protein
MGPFFTAGRELLDLFVTQQFFEYIDAGVPALNSPVTLLQLNLLVPKRFFFRVQLLLKTGDNDYQFSGTKATEIGE